MAPTLSDSSPGELAQRSLIRYPRFKELHEEIRRCQQLSRLAGESHCIALEGVTGAGKSTLVKSYANAFQRRETAEGAQVPVLYIEVPSPATVKGVAAAMLRQLGDPGASSGTLWSMNERVIYFLKVCAVELVIWDDFHHLFDSETERILAKVSDWLKVLIKETGVTFLVVGIEGKVELILQANSQLSRLFAARETLQPFGWDEAQPKTVREFSRFVEFAEKAIAMPLTKDLSRVEMLYRLHYATEGVVGNVMNLLRYAAMLAGQQGKEAVDLALLSQAFQRRLQKHLRYKVNPFERTVDESFIPSPSPSCSDGNRQPAKKKRRPSLNAVLST
jgi:Cdc6-like AAA superfamily ATPase